MKIAVNSIPLLGPKTGVGNYAWNICRILEDLPDGPELSYYYGHFSRQLMYSQTEHPFVRTFKDTAGRIPLVKSLYRRIRNIRARIQIRQFDIYFEPNFIPLDLKFKRLAVTVHDFSFHLHPKWHPAERVEYFRDNFWKNIQRADAIITVSNFIRNQAVDEFGFDSKKVHVIPNGFDQSLFHPLQPHDRVLARQRLNLPDRFVLFVGSIEPRKNLLNLLDAYASLPQSLQNSTPLVLAGFRGWENTTIMRRLERLHGNVRYLGFVQDEDLAALYALAELFVYPSFYEGFGLPPLEAMACGCPVLVANASSLPEVGADAVLYTSPDNVEEMAAAMQNVLENSSLGQRLRVKGLERASSFSWQASALAHLDLFRRLGP
jgi:glycosyltransferase involved in cell wall biosynthesis